MGEWRISQAHCSFREVIQERMALHALTQQWLGEHIALRLLPEAHRADYNYTQHECVASR